MVHGLETIKWLNDILSADKIGDAEPTDDGHGVKVTARDGFRTVVHQDGDKSVTVTVEKKPIEIKEGAWYKLKSGGVIGPAVRKPDGWKFSDLFLSNEFGFVSRGWIVNEVPWHFVQPTIHDLAAEGKPIDGWMFSGGKARFRASLLAVRVYGAEGLPFFCRISGNPFGQWLSDFRVSVLK